MPDIEYHLHAALENPKNPADEQAGY
jgi:hypothetical protein